MTEQRLEYANSLMAQKNDVKADLIWLENLSDGDKPFKKNDLEKLKLISLKALESLLSYLDEEFKKL